MTATTQWLLSWQEAVVAGPSMVGGKGWNLARLARYGFRVPPGGVLSVAAGQRFLDFHGLRPADLAGHTEDLEALPLPDDLAQAIDAALADWDIANVPSSRMALSSPASMASRLSSTCRAPCSISFREHGGRWMAIGGG